MRIGFGLPSIGPLATPEILTTVATRAEALDYHSLWVADRLLYPVAPRTPYAVTPDGSLPDEYRRSMDPLDALLFVAARTSRIRIGTSVLDMPFYNPVLLARRLTTIDVLSGGRLSVGLGLGWSEDEFEAAGTTSANRGPRADEFLGAMKAAWTQNPAEFHGTHYSLPSSIFDLRPVQQPHPPIYLAAYVPAAMKRVATMSNGWNPAGVPMAGMQQMWAGIKAMAQEAGRDPASLELVVRANLVFTQQPLPEEGRFIFVGSFEQIAQDVQATAAMGAHEIILEAGFSSYGASVESLLGIMERLRGTVG